MKNFFRDILSLFSIFRSKKNFGLFFFNIHTDSTSFYNNAKPNFINVNTQFSIIHTKNEEIGEFTDSFYKN